MKISVLILLLISTAFISCAKKNVEKTTATTTKTKIEKDPIKVSSKSSFEANEVLEIPVPITKSVQLMAKINRTPCFGKCPVFTIELFDDGVVKYTGIAYVQKIGTFTAKATPELIARIQSKALSIKYLKFENKYPIAPVVIADLPTTTTFIRIGEEDKQITDNFDAPRDLIDFENWLVQQFEKLDWQAE